MRANASDFPCAVSMSVVPVPAVYLPLLLLSGDRHISDVAANLLRSIPLLTLAAPSAQVVSIQSGLKQEQARVCEIDTRVTGARA